MILPVSGISTTIPTNYEEIKRRLLALGLSPTGNFEVDKSRLKQAIEKRVEKFELKKKEEIETEKKSQQEKLEEEKIGAVNLAELNKIYHKLY